MAPVDFVQLLLGLGFAIGAPIQYAALRARWARRTRTATGTVVGYEARASSGYDDFTDVPTFHAEVEFEVHGRTWTAVSPYGVSWQKPRPGERREVVYNPGDPGDAEVLSELGRKLEQAILLALPLVGVALLIAFAIRRF